MKKTTLSILATLLMVAQGLSAQTTVTTADALYNAVTTSQTVTLGQDITLDNGRLDIDGTTVTLDLNGHTLTRPMTAADAGGQVIAVKKGGKLTISDASGNNHGKITGGWAYQGGGIYVYEGGELTISGGTITGNRADQIAEGGYGFGGGVENHGTLTISGGTITGNTAGQHGGGIYQASVCYVEGNPVIDDLYLNDYCLITLTGALTTGASIGLSAGKVDQTHFTVDYHTYHAGTAPDAFFTSKNSSYALSLNADGEIVYGAKYIERAWDSSQKKVTETAGICSSFTAINGSTPNDGGWIGLNDGWYVATANASHKVLNVMGTDVKLIIPDGVTLNVKHVKMQTGKKLTIYGQSGDTGTLTAVNDDDELKGAAGIGGGEEAGCGTIVIHGGTINATGGEFGAGIGSGNEYEDALYAGRIDIYGGTVNATGGAKASGIGGGDYGRGAELHIYGGTITARSGENGSAIGGGRCGAGRNTVIDGGTVEAYGTIGGGGNFGEDRGADDSSNGGYVEINGGTVTAHSGGGHPGRIGPGVQGEGVVVLITGGNVTVSGSAKSAGIGGADTASGPYDITITGGTITTSGSQGIGPGYYPYEDREYRYRGKIIITGGTIYATGNLRAIGGRTEREGDLDDFTYTLFDGAKVTAGADAASASAFPAAERVPATMYRNYAVIEPCSHDGATYTVSGASPGDTHTKHCSYCTTTFTAETHTIGTDGKCTVCGVETNTYTVTVKVPANNGAQDGVYEAVTYKMVPGTTFTLPASPVTFNDRVFEGWLVGEAQNSSYTARDGENRLEAGAEYTINEDVTFTARYSYIYITLNDNADNSETLSRHDGMFATIVTLKDRTLFKDGSWNTLCLPFALSSLTGTPLADATVKTLESAAFDKTDGTLTLTFSENLTAIEAGKPYIVKWENTGGADPKIIQFGKVTISNISVPVKTEAVTFTGRYSSLSIGSEGDNTKLYLGADDKLYYPTAQMTIGACRAYFQLADGITAGDPADGIRSIVLNFGDEGTGIISAEANSSLFTLHSSLSDWFTLDGRRLTGMPTAKGIYIYNGRKVVIK